MHWLEWILFSLKRFNWSLIGSFSYDIFSHSSQSSSMMLNQFAWYSLAFAIDTIGIMNKLQTTKVVPLHFFLSLSLRVSVYFIQLRPSMSTSWADPSVTVSFISGLSQLTIVNKLCVWDVSFIQHGDPVSTFQVWRCDQASTELLLGT